jgi:hypothetical protein
VQARRTAILPEAIGRRQRGSAMFAAKSREAEQKLPEGIREPRNVEKIRGRRLASPRKLASARPGNRIVESPFPPLGRHQDYSGSFLPVAWIIGVSSGSSGRWIEQLQSRVATGRCETLTEACCPIRRRGRRYCNWRPKNKQRRGRSEKPGAFACHFPKRATIPSSIRLHLPPSNVRGSGMGHPS